jgi:hypothetical protein
MDFISSFMTSIYLITPFVRMFSNKRDLFKSQWIFIQEFPQKPGIELVKTGINRREEGNKEVA